MRKNIIYLAFISIVFCMGCEDSADILRPADVNRPEKPTGMQATATGATIHLTWNSITDSGSERIQCLSLDNQQFWIHTYNFEID